MTHTLYRPVEPTPQKEERKAGGDAPADCVSCGGRIDAAFCAACGEQRPTARHYGLTHFAGEVLEAFVHADGRALSTVKLLLTRPGVLTVAYMHGKRRPYMTPLQLFFVVNVVYFLWVALTWTNTFGTPLQFHVNGVFYSSVARRLVLARLIARHATYAQYAAAFDHTAMLQAKSLIILMAPLFALGTALVILPRRAYAVQHLVFALHAMCVLLLDLIVAGVVANFAINEFSRVTGVRYAWHTYDAASTLLILLALAVYLRAALRRVYGFGALSATGRAVGLCAVLVATVVIYRGILFFTTFAAT